MNPPCHTICLTPTRNEAWIIQRFAAAARHWASHLIVADQGSTDSTLQQLRGMEGVQVVLNESKVFDEVHRQRLLLNQARQIEGKRILIALDADEALSFNCTASKEWEQLREAKPGTLLRFPWVNILPGFKEAWIPPAPLLCGFVDDGSGHSGRRIHNPRVPVPDGAPVIDFKEIVVLHFQYVVWQRMLSKQRWYQMLEYTAHGDKSPLDLYREYNHMRGSWTRSEIRPLDPRWLAGYERIGADFRTLQCEPVTWWDADVVQKLRAHGPQRFRKLAIWDQDWNAVAHQLGVNGIDLADPRSLVERKIHGVLAATQDSRTNWGVRALEHALRFAGW